jgi:predicted methyltransferase
MVRTSLAIAVASIVLTGCQKAEPARQFSQHALEAALADPARKDQREAADARRKPGPLIALAGIKPGDKVLDLIPGSGYWTRIFSKIVGPHGKVYAVWPQSYARFAMGNVQDMKKLSADKYYGNIVTDVQPSAVLNAPEPLDVVWTSQNYHDYPDEYMGKDADPDALNRAVFKILKPGGTYMIIDHMAKAGRGMADTEKLHRIDPAVLKADFQRAGFVLEAESDLLRNPADDHSLLVFDEKIRGKTDRAVFRFRKPS